MSAQDDNVVESIEPTPEPTIPVLEPPVSASQKGIKYASPLVVVAVIAAFYVSYSQMFAKQSLPSDDLSHPTSIAGSDSTHDIVKEHDAGMAELKARFKARQAEKAEEALKPVPVPEAKPMVALDEMAWDAEDVGDELPMDALEPTPAPIQDVAPLQAEIALLQQQKAALEAQLQAQQAQLTQQQQQLAQAQAAAEQAQHSSLDAQQMQARLRLAMLIRANKPYAGALEQVQGLTPEMYEGLKQWQNEGMPSDARIAQALQHAIATWQAQPLPETASWWTKTKHNLTSLVKVRKVGMEHQGMDDEARIARIEVMANQHDYASSLNEMNGLSEKVKVLFQEVQGLIHAHTIIKNYLVELQGLEYGSQP